MSQVLLRFLVSPCRVNLAWLPAVLCLGGFLVSCFFFKDLLLGFDQFNQFFQAQYGIIGDWHSPILGISMQYISYTALWMIFCGLIWSGFFLCIRFPSFWNSNKPYWQILPVVFLLLWLSLDLFFLSSLFSKDQGFIACYLFAVGMFLNMPKRLACKVFIGLVMLGVLYYGTSLRHNAVPALLPLLCWFLWSFMPANGRHSFKRLLMICFAALLLWCGYIALNHYVNYSVIKAVRLYSMAEIFSNDIWHINFITDNYIVPPNGFGNDFTTFDEKFFREKYNNDQLFCDVSFSKLNNSLPIHKWLNMTRSGTIIYDEKDDLVSVQEAVKKSLKSDARGFVRFDIMGFTPLSQIKEHYASDYAALFQAWKKRILLDPFAYLKFKARFYLRLFRDHDLWFLRLNGLSVLPFTILITCIGLFSRSRLSKAEFPALMLAFSALFYVLPLFFFCPSEQPRYLYWFYAASFISIAYFLAHSPLFAAIMQTVQQYGEEKALPKR